MITENPFEEFINGPELDMTALPELNKKFVGLVEDAVAITRIVCKGIGRENSEIDGDEGYFEYEIWSPQSEKPRLEQRKTIAKQVFNQIRGSNWIEPVFDE